MKHLCRACLVNWVTGRFLCFSCAERKTTEAAVHRQERERAKRREKIIARLAVAPPVEVDLDRAGEAREEQLTAVPRFLPCRRCGSLVRVLDVIFDGTPVQVECDLPDCSFSSR